MSDAARQAAHDLRIVLSGTTFDAETQDEVWERKVASAMERFASSRVKELERERDQAIKEMGKHAMDAGKLEVELGQARQKALEEAAQAIDEAGDAVSEACDAFFLSADDIGGRRAIKAMDACTRGREAIRALMTETNKEPT